VPSPALSAAEKPSLRELFPEYQTYSITEVSEFLSLSPRTLSNKVQRGELSCVRTGIKKGRLIFSEANIREYLKDREERGKANKKRSRL